MNKYPAILFTAVSFSLSWAVILSVTAFGQSTNSLHQSAQAWAFTVILGILAAYGIGSLNLAGTFWASSQTGKELDTRSTDPRSTS